MSSGYSGHLFISYGSYQNMHNDAAKLNLARKHEACAVNIKLVVKSDNLVFTFFTFCILLHETLLHEIHIYH